MAMAATIFCSPQKSARGAEKIKGIESTPSSRTSFAPFCGHANDKGHADNPDILGPVYTAGVRIDSGVIQTTPDRLRGTIFVPELGAAPCGRPNPGMVNGQAPVFVRDYAGRAGACPYGVPFAVRQDGRV